MNFRELDWKKIGLITVFLLATIIFGLLLYIFFFRPAPPPTGIESENVNTGGGVLPLTNEALVIRTENGNVAIGLPPQQNINASPYVSNRAKGGLTIVNSLINNEIKGLTLAGNGSDLLYYNTGDKKFYRITPDGKPSLLIDKRFFDVDNVAFAKSKNKAIIEYPDGANIFYNFTNGAQVTLPNHWEQFNFSKQTDTVGFKNIGINEDNNFLAIANADGSQAQIVEPISDNVDKVKIDWSPDDQVVALYADSLSTEVSGEQQEIILLGKNHENFKSFAVEGYNFESEWSKTGDRLLYSVHNADSDFIPELWMVNSQGNAIGSGRRNLRVKTWAHKCAFASNSIVYCGVPDSTEEGIGFVPVLGNTVPDQFYKIDLDTGTKSLLAKPDGDFTVASTRVSEDGKYLYFTDMSGRLFKINL